MLCVQLEDDAAFMDKYSRQIGAFGLEAMSKLMNLKVLIVGLRCVAGCRCVSRVPHVSFHMPMLSCSGPALTRPKKCIGCTCSEHVLQAVEAFFILLIVMPY